jgi:glycosyltransferase involved in cell wall biosynthesis
VRILVATLLPYPSPTAHLVHITALAQGFVTAGHDVHLVAAQPGPGWPGDGPEDALGFAPGYRVTVLAGRDHRGQSAVNLVRTARLLRRGPYDVCISDHVRTAALTAARGLPTVFEAHSLHFADSPLDRAALRRFLAAGTPRAVVAISDGLRRDLIATFGDAVEPVTVLPEAAPLDEVPPAAPLPGARPGAVQVGYTGALYRGRGVEVMTAVAAALPDVDVHVVGGPPAEADRLRTDPARPANLHVHGPTSPARARAVQRTMDVLLAPYQRSVATSSGHDTSRWMSPMKLFEYLASRRAIVCSDLPVLREVLEDGVTARLVPPDDAGAWVAAVRELAEDPARRRGLGERGRAQAVAHHGWEQRTARMLATLGR